MTDAGDTIYPFDVFVSYSHDDAGWVRGELLSRLESAGLKVIIDHHNNRTRHPVNRRRSTGHAAPQPIADAGRNLPRRHSGTGVRVGIQHVGSRRVELGAGSGLRRVRA